MASMSACKYVFFTPMYRVRRDIRKWCIFGHHDLTHDAPLSHVDLLVCRNVLIYFDPATKAQVVRRLFEHLSPGGWLFLSPAESAATRAGLGNSVFPGVYAKPL